MLRIWYLVYYSALLGVLGLPMLWADSIWWKVATYSGWFCAAVWLGQWEQHTRISWSLLLGFSGHVAIILFELSSWLWLVPSSLLFVAGVVNAWNQTRIRAMINSLQ